MVCYRGRCLEGTEAAVRRTMRRTTSYALWLWAHVSPFTTRFPHVGVLVVGMPKEIYQVSTQDRGGSGIAAAVCSFCAVRLPELFVPQKRPFFHFLLHRFLSTMTLLLSHGSMGPLNICCDSYFTIIDTSPLWKNDCRRRGVARFPSRAVCGRSPWVNF